MEPEICADINSGFLLRAQFGFSLGRSADRFWGNRSTIWEISSVDIISTFVVSIILFINGQFCGIYSLLVLLSHHIFYDGE